MQRKEQIAQARERWRRIAKVVAQGTPPRAAAERFGVSVGIVHRAVFAAKIKPTRKAKEAAANRARRLEMYRMVMDGHSPADVARRFGTRLTEVRYAIRENRDVA